MSDFFKTFINQVLCCMKGAEVIICNYFMGLNFISNPIKEYNGKTLVMHFFQIGDI